MIKFIDNSTNYFASNYFEDDFLKTVIGKSGFTAEDIKRTNAKINGLKEKYYRYKRAFINTTGKRVGDRIQLTHEFHSELLNVLGYPGDQAEYDNLFLIDAQHKQVIPIRHRLMRGGKPHLYVMEMQALIEHGGELPKGIFEQRYYESQWKDLFTIKEEGYTLSPSIINKAISQLFLLEEDRCPTYVMLLAGSTVFLLHNEQWHRGSFLQFNLEQLFIDASLAKQKDCLSLFYLLVSKTTLSPDSEVILMEQLDEDSHKSAFAVTKDLKTGVINAVELLANEAVLYMKQEGELEALQEKDNFAEDLKNDCLTFVYRLLFVFYAEARPELGILPYDDESYRKGYSLEILRDLEQVPLLAPQSKNGYFFHESISRLFYLIRNGFRPNEVNNRSFSIKPLDSPLFDPTKLHYLDEVKISNHIWQSIIKELSLSQITKGRRGRISYANLGVNQLGAVYESLLAFRGFFAKEDLIEVAAYDKKKKKQSTETHLVSRRRSAEFDQNEIVKEDSYSENYKVIKEGTFVYRLSGRDRQKSASYYTPEELTRTTVKYTLKHILERIDDPKDDFNAIDLLKLKILEPAMGASAFQNEVVNQLAEAYLKYRQAEIVKKGGKRISPEHYQNERQKVKAYIADNNVYGVDINPTAIELGKLALYLNVIHKDMETPFFGHMLACGNAVVGAWLKVYKEADIIHELEHHKNPKTGKIKSTPKRKAWWESAPKMRRWKGNKINRKPDEIYHFLLPDKNMLPTANHKFFRAEEEERAKALVMAELETSGVDVSKLDKKAIQKKIKDKNRIERIKIWEREFIKPYSPEEFRHLQTLCDRVDQLFKEHYDFHKLIGDYTHTRSPIYGKGSQYSTKLGYEDKARFAQQRELNSTPYFQLKMVMDYWCSLWFWEVEQADQLPNRSEYMQDLAHLLQVDLAKKMEEATSEQTIVSTTELAAKDRMAESHSYLKDREGNITVSKITQLQQKQNLFDDHKRLQLVQDYAKRYRFLHYQLEFVEVFKERGGFDVVVGNPPWIKLNFEEKGIISEQFPEVLIRKTSAPQVRKLQAKFLANENLKAGYVLELGEMESTTTFMNSVQNYPLLKGQQTNLYKCVLENGFSWLSKNGYLGLLHPEGVYDDPNGQLLRKEIYQRLKFHFQFKNELMLFSEIDHHNSFGAHIYSGNLSSPDFISINNLFHPSTIDGCFIHDGKGITGGYKIKDEQAGKMVWNVQPHASRLVRVGEQQLKILATTFEGTSNWAGAKLVSIHAKEIMAVLEKLGRFPTSVRDFENKITVCWDETNDLNAGNIKRSTQYPDIDKYEMIYSGPHFFVSNPLYKSPRETCVLSSDYDIIDHMQIDEGYLARTNYIPPTVDVNYGSTMKGFEIGKDDKGNPVYDNWLDYYKVGFNKMLNLTMERTLQPSILPPKTTHIFSLISACLKSDEKILELSGVSSSICFDFFVKTMGAANLTDSRIQGFPLGIDQKYLAHLNVRSLLLNSLNKYYTRLWERHWKSSFRQDTWSKSDPRLKLFTQLSAKWEWATPLRNWYERRWALVEIDVLTAMALGLNLKELILIYNVQFPVLQQNEDDTWYDTKGNIVFTCSKGLTGVGLDRSVWNTIRDMKAGEEYVHVIEKSELYKGQEVVYYAPFDKCDRVEDYGVVWAVFEGRF